MYVYVVQDWRKVLILFSLECVVNGANVTNMIN
jgi:hypothetical protein